MQMRSQRNKTIGCYRVIREIGSGLPYILNYKTIIFRKKVMDGLRAFLWVERANGVNELAPWPNQLGGFR